MYYVARLYTQINPSIIMDFSTKELAMQYVELMTKAGKGAYVVLEPIHEYTPPTPILK